MCSRQKHSYDSSEDDDQEEEESNKAPYKYLYKLSLSPASIGKVLEYHPICEPSEIINMCYTASENYLLVSYQHARVKGTESIKVPYVRIINTHDWSICNEIYNRNSVLNTCIWCPSHEGYVYGTDSGDVCIHTIAFNDNKFDHVQFL